MLHLTFKPALLILAQRLIQDFPPCQKSPYTQPASINPKINPPLPHSQTPITSTLLVTPFPSITSPPTPTTKPEYRTPSPSLSLPPPPCPPNPLQAPSNPPTLVRLSRVAKNSVAHSTRPPRHTHAPAKSVRGALHAAPGIVRVQWAEARYCG